MYTVEITRDILIYVHASGKIKKACYMITSW